MSRFIFVALVVAAAGMLLAGCGGDSESVSMPQSLLKGCGGHVDKVSGSTIVKVGAGQCVEADDGATVIASGDAIVAAHGNSTVDAKDNVTLVVYNDDVTCNIRGARVTVIDAIRVGWSLIEPSIDVSCDTSLAP